LAFGDERGTVVFHEFVGNSSAGSLLPEISSRAGGNWSVIEKMVEVRTIDDFVRESGIASNMLCKIDTEGNDIRVIRGARNTIKERIVPMFVN
jgi:FkbM family methyltransferase